MTSILHYSLPVSLIGNTPFSSIPDKRFMVKQGKEVFAVYEGAKSMTYREVEKETKKTLVPWKFIGSAAIILPTKVWLNLHANRRSKPIYIPLDVPKSTSQGHKLVAFIASEVDIQEVSITGKPIPKKKKKSVLPTSMSFSIARSANRQGPSHINTFTRANDGYVIYSTDTTAKLIKTGVIFNSSSTPGKTYEVVIYTDKSVSCNCPAWTKKVPRKCKHIVDDTVVDVLKKL